jgi:hypothetical protein
MRTRSLAPVVAALLLTVAAIPAAACGFCVEDRVAAVYDQGAVDAARAGERAVAFLGFDGEPAATQATRRALVAALEANGAVRGSTRVALENGACAFAYDPARTEIEALVAGANRRLRDRHLVLSVLRWIDAAGTLREP